ncbi:hypothetical protein JW710_01155 [Candidatus Dojkabacteria bacterium]|nr:hypothetical protein [Candidatus Dojkabacteria bacterium]
MVDPGSNSSNAANIIIYYDPSDIEILDENTSVTGVQIGTGDAYEAYAENIVSTSAGTIKLTGFSIMSQLTESRVFGTIRFRSLTGVTNTSMSIQFTGVGNTLDSNIAETYTSDDILGSVGSASYSFESGPCFDDNRAPSITPVDPVHYQPDVPLDSNIEVTICDNQPYDTGVDIETVEIVVNGVTYTYEDTAFFTYTGDPSCYNITIDPESDFPEDEAVSVVYIASDFAGNTASRTIIFNVPEGDEETAEYIREIIRELEECQDQECNCAVELPDTAILEENPALTSALVSIPTVASFLSLLPAIGFSFLELPYYIMQLISWILNLLGLAKKGRPWGIVYDSITKSPVSRAVVRLFSEGQLIESKVTDVNGVFSLSPIKGVYTLMVSKRGYVFPSTVVVGDNDGPRLNVYRGGPYTVESDKEAVKLSIPMDPKKVSMSTLRFRRMWSKFTSFMAAINPILMVLGLILSLVVYILIGGTFNLVLAILNTIMLVIEVIRRYVSKEKWGIVVDSTGRPLSNVKIGLYDRIYNKLVDVRVTDDKGMYRFVVPGDLYFIKPATSNYVIDEPGLDRGYPVGKKAVGSIVITHKLVLRENKEPISDVEKDTGPDQRPPEPSGTLPEQTPLDSAKKKGIIRPEDVKQPSQKSHAVPAQSVASDKKANLEKKAEGGVERPGSIQEKPRTSDSSNPLASEDLMG